jgi:hypothetical protein
MDEKNPRKFDVGDSKMIEVHEVIQTICYRVRLVA